MIEIISLSVLLFVMWVVLADVRKFTNKEEYPPYVVAPALAYGFLFILIDIAYNLTVGTIVFAQIPRDWTLSGRLRRNLFKAYGSGESTWRYDLSYFICKHFISPWDPDHCGIGLE